MDPKIKFKRWLFVPWMIAVVLCGNALAEKSASSSPSVTEATWGVEPLSLTLTGSDFFLDFRFRVTDAQKASTVLSRREKAYLIDDTTGQILPVAVTKIGPLRGAAVSPKPYRTYVVLFSNINKKLKTGDPATVVIGDFTAKGIVVGGRSLSAMDLDAEKRNQWEQAQRTLLSEYAHCSEDCSADTTCREKCRRAYNSRSESAYQQLFAE